MKVELKFRKKKEKETVEARPSGITLRMIPQIDVEISGTNPKVILHIVGVIRREMELFEDNGIVEWEER